MTVYCRSTVRMGEEREAGSDVMLNPVPETSAQPALVLDNSFHQTTMGGANTYKPRDRGGMVFPILLRCNSSKWKVCPILQTV